MVDLGTKYFNSNPRRSYSPSLIKPANIMIKTKNSALALTIASDGQIVGNQSSLGASRASRMWSGVDHRCIRAEH